MAKLNTELDVVFNPSLLHNSFHFLYSAAGVPTGVRDYLISPLFSASGFPLGARAADGAFRLAGLDGAESRRPAGAH